MKDRLRQILDEFSLTQVSFAQRLGVQQSTVSMWLNGQREPTETAKRSICHEFNICREWLEDGIEPMHPTQELSDIALITRAMEGQNEHKKELMDMVKQLTEEQTKEATLVVLAMRTGYELAKAEGKQTA